MKANVYTILFLLATPIISFSQTSEKIYGLNFVGSELRLATMDVNSGEYEVVSQNVLSPDGFTQGTNDFDPIEKRFFYTSSGKFYTINASTGETIISATMIAPTPASGNNTVIPITNFAYNWLDGEIYGVNHQYKPTNDPFLFGDEELRLCKIDINTGEVNLISDTPISTTPYLSGNSDIDPINRRYFYATPEKIFTVDLDTGEPIFSTDINFPIDSVNQTFVNLTYDWQNDIIYGLHFLSVPPSNPFGNPLTSELRLATINPETGVVTVISDDITSNDGFSMGSCDIDPTGSRYFYVRQDSLYTVNLIDGTVISQINVDDPNNAIAGMTNFSYDDLTSPPLGIIEKEMGETILLEAGESVELNAWVGDDANYLWSDGSSNHSLTVAESGQYDVTITLDEFTIQGTIMVEVEPTSIDELDANIILNVFPNPTKDFIQLELKNWEGTTGMISLFDLDGRLFLEKNVTQSLESIDVRNLSSGIYLLEFFDGKKMTRKKIVIE